MTPVVLGPSSGLYSPECVEGRFFEVRELGLLGNSHPASDAARANSHPRLATPAVAGPLHNRRPQRERTDLCERSRLARLVMNAATLVAPSRCYRTLCATRYLHWAHDM